MTLYEKVYPWILSGFAAAHAERSRRTRFFVSRVETFLSLLLAWWVVPITLLGFWTRYLPRHHWPGTALHLGLLVLSVWAGIAFHQLAKKTLSGGERRAFNWRRPWVHARTYQGLIAVTLGVTFALISVGAIEGGDTDFGNYSGDLIRLPSGVDSWVGDWFRAMGYRSHADLVQADVSTKLPGWQGTSDDPTKYNEELSHVKGASLSSMNLRFTHAFGSFLPKSVLNGADLDYTNFEGADMRHVTACYDTSLFRADLGATNLQGAMLHGIKFQFGSLTGAKLQNATLTNADLRGVSFVSANLEGANLSDSWLQNARFTNANLKGANLTGANLSGAKGLSLQQLQQACITPRVDPKLSQPILPEDLDSSSLKFATCPTALAGVGCGVP
jgi:uncharacterized protein YjbI with pentapeptide repeats